MNNMKYDKKIENQLIKSESKFSRNKLISIYDFCRKQKINFNCKRMKKNIYCLNNRKLLNICFSFHFFQTINTVLIVDKNNIN
jgi:hypothetical protein